MIIKSRKVMALALLPCEIFHREFDAKLAIALILAKKHKFDVLIGYDKYFNLIIPALPASVLLEKSCSSIMWQGRIKPTTKKGGSVIVSDEEGVATFNRKNEESFYLRIDPEAARAINLYGCWGKLDYQKLRNHQPLNGKLKILGNSRSDLLGYRGELLYRKDVESLKGLFGNFVLISDNFNVEHREKNYTIPLYNVTKSEQELLEQQYRETCEERRKSREFFASLVFEAAKSLPHTTFVIRPHPLSIPTWWTNRFYSLRNVHIIYHMNMEPWILAASALVSVGCTSAIQALVARKTVIEVTHNTNKPTGRPEILEKILDQFSVETSEQLICKLKTVLDNNEGKISKFASVEKIWHNCYESNTAELFADEMQALDPVSRYTKSQLVDSINSIHAYLKRSKMSIDTTKWLNPSFTSIKEKLISLNKGLPGISAKIHKIADCLYYIVNQP